MNGKTSSIAIVGCGAVVEQYYLPALHHCAGVRCEALVDLERSRIQPIANRHGIPVTAASLEEMPSTVQGVVVAVPNDVHVHVVTDALRRGYHVLCEKPLGRNVAEVRAMADAAVEADRGLFAAMVCRRYPPVREAVQHRLCDLVGHLERIDASYGYPLDWPVKSPSYYDKARAGGGSLLDVGAHLVDALLHVLGRPSFEIVSYADDAEAGVEAEAEGRVALLLPQGPVECTVRTSRLRRLPNALILRGVGGTLEIPLGPGRPAAVRFGDGTWPMTAPLDDVLSCFTEQLEDFGRAIRDEPHELPAGASLAASIGLIERLYARRQPLTFCWDA